MLKTIKLGSAQNKCNICSLKYIKRTRGGINRGEIDCPKAFDALDNRIPTHPFVTCLIEGIKVQALVDTGSMRSFINKDVYTVMDFNNDRIDKSDLEKCRSITGGTLDILGGLTEI